VVTEREQAKAYLSTLFPEGAKGFFHFAFGVGGHYNGNGTYEYERFHERSGEWPRDRKRFLDEAMERAKTDDVYVCPYLFPKPGRHKGAALPARHFHGDDARVEDERFMLVDSGGGDADSFHPYALTEEELDSEGIRAGCRRLRAATGGDSKIADNDYLRLPGTFNHKARAQGGESRPVVLLRPGVRTPLEDLNLPADPGDATAATVDAKPLDDLDPATLPPIVRMTMGEIPDGDRSAQFHAFAKLLVKHDLDDETALACLIRHRPGVEKYGSRIAEQARRSLAKIRGADLLDALTPSCVVPPPNEAYSVAKIMHRDLWSEDRLAHLGGAFFEWTGTHWREPSAGGLSSALYDWIADKVYETKNGKTKYPTTRAKVGDLEAALRALAHREQEHSTRALVPFLNGQLDIESGKLYPHDPAYFNTYVVNMPYEPNAAKPETWIKFLADVWQGDDEQASTLMEWFGYVLSGRTDLQKMLLWLGPPRGGKGVTGRRFEDVYGGRANIAAPTLSDLAERFGLQSCIGKPLIKIADARLGGHKESGLALERVLAIVGEDSLTVDRKNREPWTGHLPGRIMVMTNELMRVRDNSGAFVSRLLVVESEQSYVGREDRTLDRRTQAELPGIVRMALDAYRRLVARGDFVQPSGGEGALHVLTDMSAPVQAFVRDRCEIDGESVATKDDLYHAWRTWCENAGTLPGDKATFLRDLYAAYPGKIRPGKVGASDDRTPVVRGLRVRTWWDD
jgi:putative DNA primase/helicase